MPLTDGTRLGPFEIVAFVAAGGMGEVYKARDSRLDRTVAIKVLPQHLSNDLAFRARFDREARAISSLQHPHICTLHDVGTNDGLNYLVMEFIEGETLSARMERKRLTHGEALTIAIQVANALARAHRGGIVHRDLKPGNIMLTKGGAAPFAKLMDFGLAKPRAISPERIMPEFTATAAVTSPSPVTTIGSVLGTVHYMSPEQIQGQEADERSDIFSFGAVLYEMLTGKRAFAGKSQLSIASAILEQDPPPIRAEQPLTSRALDDLVSACLVKDPEQRWQCAADLSCQLRSISTAGADTQSTRSHIPKSVMAIAALLLLALLAGAVLLVRRQPRSSSDVVRALITQPKDSGFAFIGDFGGPPMVSPDGHSIVFSARGSGGRRLYVRSLSDDAPRALDGTEDAAFPFWSPDSKYIAFFAQGALRKIAAEGGPTITIAPSPNARGGSWGKDNKILFTPNFRDGVYEVDANGGTPRQVLMPVAGTHTTYRWPFFLPDGKHFLYYAGNHEQMRSEHNGIFFASLDGKVNKLVRSSRSQAEYASGFIFHHQQGVLAAQPFDAESGTTKGEPVTISGGVQFDATVFRAIFSTAASGVLVYQAGLATPQTELVWYDRTGRALGTVGPKDAYGDFAISPDRTRVVATIGDSQTDLWLFDVASGRGTRLTFGEGSFSAPAWSPDGKQIAYAFRSDSAGSFPAGDAIYIRSVSGTAHPEKIVEPTPSASLLPVGWSPDGKFILYSEGSGPTGAKLMAIPVHGEHKPFVVATNNAGQATFSPDSRWVAFDTDQTGKFEIFVTPFPAGQGKWQVSANGGLSPQWSPDGKEIFYLDPDQMLNSAKVDGSGSEFQVVENKALFRLRGGQSGTQPYRVVGGNRTFLINAGSRDPSEPFTVVLNWPALVKNK